MPEGFADARRMDRAKNGPREGVTATSVSVFTRGKALTYSLFVSLSWYTI